MAPLSVDVLIVSFNTRDLLRDCLRTLLAHPPGDGAVEFGVSVLDNCSSDASADMVAEEFPSVRLIRSPVNVGFGKATNRLAATSAASHLMLLNPDTVLERDVVGPLLAGLEADPAIVVAAPRLIYPDGRVQESSERLPALPFELAREIRGTKLQPLLRPFFDVDAVLRRFRRGTSSEHDSDFLWATCWLLRRSDFPGGALFDASFPVYDEDLDFCRRQRDRGRRLVYMPSVEVVHIGGGSSTSARKRALAHAGRARYYRKHEGLATALAYRGIVAGAGFARRLRRLA